MKRLLLLFFTLVLIKVNVIAQSKPDTVKCYVQIMVPAEGGLGIARNIEDNTIYLRGGLLIYTKAYGIKDENGNYIKLLNSKRKELKDIWLPGEKPVVMKYEW